MKPYRLHLFVCQGKRCVNRGSDALLDELKERISSEGLKGEVRISRSGCIKVCKETEPEGDLCPAVVIYPEGVWYKNVGLSDIDDIMEKHVKSGEVVERLLHFRLLQ